MMVQGQLRYKEYAKRQKGTQSTVGMAIVIVLHVVLLYLIVTGLAHKLIPTMSGPLETKVIEEEKPKEDIPPPPPPKLQPPPPPFIPPPEVTIQAPVTPAANAITQTTTTKPQAPPPPAPPPPQETIAKYPRPVTQIPPRYPERALEMGREGEVEIDFTIATDGSVKDAVVVRSQPEGMFDKAALDAIKRWKYTPQEVNGQKIDTPNRRAIIRFKLS